MFGYFRSTECMLNYKYMYMYVCILDDPLPMVT